MSVADKMGLGPKRVVEDLPNGNHKITVTPPSWSAFKGSRSIEMTPEQYRSYQKWRSGFGPIQDHMPWLSAGQREVLMTGIGPEEWDEKFKNNETET